ncbi:TonB-dependent receptor [Chitinophaga sp. Mgbs1]|uniref:TonB-dependent receptor n=1 Tax=Chitinophaga solisilvae TaxID=1233460 RepID=A0A9Q5D4T1_9BACT|nr:TonB-dependent receptor [Chitinophaga solisilvae]
MTAAIRRYFTPAILLLSLVIPLLTTAQQQGTGTVTGIILNPAGNPAVAVTVAIPALNKGAVTNDDGHFLLSGVPAGNHQLRVSGVGVKQEERKINIRSGKTTVADFALQPMTGELLEIAVTEKKNRYKSDIPSSSLRLNEPLKEIPQNVQIVTSRVLADQQILSMADGVQKLVSGATRVEHWADLYTRVNTRGSRASAFRNGVNVTSSWGPLSEDMSMTDHIEFVKGPAGFMMSNGEPAGIYNVVTKKPTGTGFNGEASFTMGSFDLYRASLDLDGKLEKTGKLLYRLNVMGQQKNSFRPNEYNNRYLLAPVITYKINDQTTLTAEYTYQHVKMSDPGSAYSFSTAGYGVLPRDFTLVSSGLTPTNIDDHSAFVNLQHQISSQWKLTAQVAYFDYAQRGANIWPDAVHPDGTIRRGMGSWDARSQYKFAQAYVNGDVQTGIVRHRILGGLDMGTKNFMADFNQYFLLDSVGGEFDPRHPNYGPPNNGYPVWDWNTPLNQRGTNINDQSYTGLYIQDELGFFDNRVRLTLAGRYTYVKQNEGGPTYDAKKFTPRLGLSVSIDKQTAAYALYDQSFIPQTGFLRDSSQIKPQTGNNLELGIKRDWMDSKWSTTLSVYRIIRKGELRSDPNNQPTEKFSVVLGQTKTQGIEFDMKGELLPGLNLLINYAYTDAKIDQATKAIPELKVGDRVPGYATHNANAWLSYKLEKSALKGLGFAGGFSYLKNRDSWTWTGHDDIAGLPDYFRLDGSLFWEKGKMRITANIYNILDKYLYTGTYEDWAKFYSWQTEAGRNLRFNIAYRF